jgi:hypothetical protein
MHRANRGRERPRKILMEDVEEDLREKGIRVWKRKVEKRSEWATMLK